MMPETPSSDLLARYLSGEATDADRAAVEAWAAIPANRRELDRLRALWRPAPERDWKVEDAWQRVAARLDAPSVVEWAAPPQSRRWVVALAATVVLALGAALVWRSLGTEVLPASVYLTSAGERRTVNLPDGTEVILAPNSTLRTEDGFGRASRRVDLEGEAWFAVQHDAARPFEVHASGTIIEDLGTEFLVQELAGGAGVRVALVSGSASLRREGDPASSATTLVPNDVGVLESGEAVATVEHDQRLEALVSWHAGRLEFEDAPLAEVVVTLARWYGRPVRLADSSLGARRFTGTLRLDALADALEVLRLSLGVAAEERGDTVIVR